MNPHVARDRAPRRALNTLAPRGLHELPVLPCCRICTLPRRQRALNKMKGVARSPEPLLRSHRLQSLPVRKIGESAESVPQLLMEAFGCFDTG